MFALLAAAPLAANSQTFFSNNGTINYAVNGDAAIGYANDIDFINQTNGYSPIINFVTGGSADGLYAYNNSVVNLRGGSIGALYAYNSSIINMSGGNIVGLFASDSSTVNLSGGNISSSLFTGNHSTLNIYGTGLTALLVNPTYGPYSQYFLSGTLQDGILLNNRPFYVQNNSGASFHLFNTAAVPEPGAIALVVGVMLAGAGLLRRRK